MEISSLHVLLNKKYSCEGQWFIVDLSLSSISGCSSLRKKLVKQTETKLLGPPSAKPNCVHPPPYSQPSHYKASPPRALMNSLGSSRAGCQRRSIAAPSSGNLWGRKAYCSVCTNFLYSSRFLCGSLLYCQVCLSHQWKNTDDNMLAQENKWSISQHIFFLNFLNLKLIILWHTEDELWQNHVLVARVGDEGDASSSKATSDSQQFLGDEIVITRQWENEPPVSYILTVNLYSSRNYSATHSATH